jgi:hypothetical protein
LKVTWTPASIGFVRELTVNETGVPGPSPEPFMVIISPGESELPTPLAELLIMNGCGVVLAEINKATEIVVVATFGAVKVKDPLYEPGCRLCGDTATVRVPGVVPLGGETEIQLSLTEATV